MTINIPLSVSEYAGIQRVDEPLTSGIPLPESANIISVLDLEVCDTNNNRIPAQFTVLSRWHGVPSDETKPIKWVLLDFNANVDIGGTSTYYLRDGAVDSTSATNLKLTEFDDSIVVNTGVANFTINKNYFNLFDYVNIDGKNIVSQPNDGGVILTSKDGTKYYTTLEAPEKIEIEEQGPMRTVIKIRGVFKAEDGSYFAPSITNPAKSSRGRFSQPYPNSFIYYNFRIHFYNNKDYVKVFFTLENNGANGNTNPEPNWAPIQAVNFDSVNLIIKQNSANQLNIASEDSLTQLGLLDSFILYQDWKENLTDSRANTLESTFENGIYYTTKKNFRQLSTGQTNPGWIDANDNSQGIGLAIRHFWQNFPKKITVNNSEIKIGFWPEEGYFPYCQRKVEDPDNVYCGKAGRDGGAYVFDGGRHKTYEIFLRFYSGNEDAQTQKLSKSLEEPLMALATSEWYSQTKALGMIGPSGFSSFDSEIDEAMERYDRFQTGMVYREDSDNRATILSIKTQKSPTWEVPYQDMFFSWANFGDLLWHEQSFCSLHYDWTYKMLLHYIRTGKRKLFDTGVEMAKHRYDIDQYHGERTDTQMNHKWTTYFQYYELDGNGHGGRVGGPTHNWNSGIILYYLLTGDKKSLDAAEENTKGILNHFGKGGLGGRDSSVLGCTGEVRAEGWSMLNLVNLYRVTGNSLYLETAKDIVKNRILYTEQESGGRGVITGGKSGSFGRALEVAGCECVETSDNCNRCKNTLQPLMVGYISEGMIAVHQETQDEELGALLVRTADFLKNKMLFGGDYNAEGQYRTIRTNYVWVEEDPDGSIRMDSDYYKSYHCGYVESIYTLFWADYFAYAYKLTNNSEYLDWARKCFRDMMFYYAAPTEYVNPEYRSRISFMDGNFPHSHTKIHGWIGRTNQVYLHTEWQLQQSGDIPGDLNKDQVIDVDDYISIMDALGTQKDEIGYIPDADYDANDKVTYSDFKKWYKHYQNR